MFLSDIFKTKSIQTIGKKSLIGKGSYGCVIKPAIIDKFEKRYIEYDNESDNDVGKLFKNIDEKYFKKELKILKGIDKIDPNSIFTVKLKGANAISEDIFKSQSSDIKDCLDIREHSYGLSPSKKLIYQIIIENGGKEVKKISNYSVDYIHFLEMFKTFLFGIKNMHSVDLIHRDIKPENILVSDNKISLIDFGISEQADKIFNKENYDYLSYLYPYYPPEFFIASILLKYRNNKERFIVKLDNIIDILQNNYLNIMFKEKKIYSIVNELQDFINEIKLRNYGYYDVFNKDLAYKSDIYGLSFIINEFANKLIYTNENQKIAVYNLYKMCSEINPYKRANIDDLISYIDEIKDITIKYGGKSNRNKKILKKKLIIPKIHKEELNNKVNIDKKKNPYIIKLSIKLKIK